MFGRSRLRHIERRLDALKAELLRLRELQCMEHWERMMQLPRYREELRLLRFGYRVYSQNDEDGIIEEIFNRIGAANRFFIEFGVDVGLESNTTNLLVNGWRGLWVESREKAVVQMRERFKVFTEAEKRLHIEQMKVGPDNVNDILQRAAPFEEPDLLSIDVDGNDYWIWQAVSARRPRVVAVEYNASWRPPNSVTMSYDQAHVWRGTNYFGASLKALEKLGASKGYNLVGCCFAGVNAFFVRRDLCGDKFLAPFSAENHYEPRRSFMVGNAAGLAPGIGPLTTV